MRLASDFHLGLNRKAHTTLASRKRLASALIDSAYRAVAEGNPSSVVCAGDLFDTYSNREITIIEAAHIAAKCDVVLAGNHDMLNTRDSIGSLQVVNELLEDTTVIQCPDFGKPFVEYGELEGMQLAFIPHHATQELFDEAVASVKSEVSHIRGVFLHCNYENEMTHGSDTSLNLTRKQAEALLEVSDYVFLGHEHEPRSLLDDRLIILGNTFPTSFADISDKYYYDLTPESLGIVKIWDMKTGYKKLEYNGDQFPAIPEAQFIEVTGKITIDKGVDLAEYLREIWEVSGALMVRNSVSVVSDYSHTTELVDFDKLPDEISKQLEGTPLEDKWHHYRGILNAE